MHFNLEAKLAYLKPGTVYKDPVTVTILNARQQQLPPWQRINFELLSHETMVTDWNDSKQLLNLFYEEIAEISLKQSGADIVTIGELPFIRKSPKEFDEDCTGLYHEIDYDDHDIPITLIHSDFAPNYVELIEKRHSNPDKYIGNYFGKFCRDKKFEHLKFTDAKRIMVLNFWKNIGPEVMDFPLAICDPYSVTQQEVRSIPIHKFSYFDTLGLQSGCHKHHRWYYWPGMNINEILMFKTFDTGVQEHEPYWVFHGAFRDPTVKLNQPARISIEARVNCFFF